MSYVEVIFMPERKPLRVRKGTTLLEAARKSFIDIESQCNGRGTCGKCRIQHIEGEVDKPHPVELKHLSEDELTKGLRLACQSRVGGMAIFKVLNLKGKHRILSEGFTPKFELNPCIKKVFFELSKPSLDDNVDDLSRLKRVIGKHLQDSIPILVLRELPKILRQNKFEVTLIFSDDHLVGIEPGNTTDRCYGVAVDIGTTTVVSSLFDLNSGAELATSVIINPQKSYGLDVLSRIQYVQEQPDGLKTLSDLIRNSINSLIKNSCTQTGIHKKNIYEITIAANATMMHLLTGIDPTSLGSSPYVPTFTSPLNFPASELGLKISDFGRVYCLPSVSGYIGADIVAGIVASELHKSSEVSLLIDIGTNGEIVLGSKDGLSACSCAAGPALEGMNISCGMPAIEGAVEKVFIDEDIVIQTIGDKPAVGICGSGIIDAVAELIKVGTITKSGRLVRSSFEEKTEPCQSMTNNNSSKFIIGINPAKEEIAITQKDIRQVQLAKGAIFSGIVALTSQLDVDTSEIKHVYIAGAFGHHLRLESLIRLGILPEQCLKNVSLIGNSSKTGAALSLLSKKKREEASEISKQVNYYELSCYPGFDRLFSKCLPFPKSSPLEEKRYLAKEIR